MGRRSKEKLEGKHLMLFAGDFDELAHLLGGKIAPSVAIRVLVRKFKEKLKAKVEQTVPSHSVEIDLNDLSDNPSEPAELGSNLLERPEDSD